MNNSSKKTYLFLQGPFSDFFRNLGERLKSQGHEILKVNFNGGDLFFWNNKDTVDFTQKTDRWKDFLKELDEKHNFSDVMLYGDCRFYHAVAVDFFRQKNKKVHVFEEGYFRPNWITHEINGVNGYSQIPKYREFYDGLKQNTSQRRDVNLDNAFTGKILNTYIYYVFRSFFEAKKFRHYISHRTQCPSLEAKGWFSKIAKHYFNKRINLKKQSEFLSSDKPFFLLALQLCSDTQIKFHSDFEGMKEVIEYVINSFAKFAPDDKFLLIKTHPEENGLARLGENTENLIRNYGLEGRVVFLDGGNMPQFLRNMEAMITVNSTSGMSALHHNKPVKCLGRAIYNFEGLTDQQNLNDFWQSPRKPDEILFKKFKYYVMEYSQVNGNYYSEEGIKTLLQNIEGRV